MFYTFMVTKNVFDKVELNVLRQLEENLTKDNFNYALYQTWRIITRGRDYPNNISERVFSNVKDMNMTPFHDEQLNIRGLHVFRIIYSRYAHLFRDVPKQLRGFYTNGVLAFPNFISNPDDVLEETFKYKICNNKQLHNIISLQKNSPHLKNLLHSRMQQLILDIIDRPFDDDARQLYMDNTFVQRIHNKPNDGDEQKDVHSDIFFPAIKWWYFPQAVTIADGPLHYALYSPDLNIRLLEFFYQQSLKCSTNTIEEFRGRSHMEGSFRVTDAELQQLGLKCNPMTVSKNTLLVANVFGFHGRGDVTRETVRTAIHGSIRVKDPFAI